KACLGGASHINKSLDVAEYPYTKDPAGGPDGNKSSGSELRSLRPTWFMKGQETKNPRIIVFITGGVTYSELRTAYEITEKHRQDVIIGSTHIITPQKFVEDMSLLHNPPTQSYSPPKSRPLPAPPNVPTAQNYNQYNKSPSAYGYPQGGQYSQPPYSQQGAFQGGNYQQQGNYSYNQSNPGYQQGYPTRPQYMNPKP
ncbi:15244_t:CDS:2, partial [Racocetra persica]